MAEKEAVKVETPVPEPKAKTEKRTVAKITGEDSLLSGSKGGVELVEEDVPVAEAGVEETPEAKADREAKEKQAEADEAKKKETPEQKTEREKKEKEEQDAKIAAEAKDKVLILGRFKTNADVEKALGNLASEYSKVMDEVKAMEKQLGKKLLDEEFIDIGLIRDDNERIEKYRKLERAYTIATQKRSEGRKTLAEHNPDDELLRRKSEDELETEWKKIQESPNNHIIALARREVKRILDMERKKDEIAREEMAEKNKVINREVENFISENPDFPQLKDAINEYIGKYIPVGANLPAKSILKLAYDAVKGKRPSESEIAKQIEDAKIKQAEAEEAEKRRSQVVNGSGAGGGKERTDKTTPSEEENIADSILKAESGGVFD